MGRFGVLGAPQLSLPLGREAACISVSSAELGPGGHAPPPALCPDLTADLGTQPQEGQGRRGPEVGSVQTPPRGRGHGPSDPASLHRRLSFAQTDGALVSERLCGWGPLLGTSVSREWLLPGERPPPRSPAVLPLDPRFFPTPPSHSSSGPLTPFPWLGLCVVGPGTSDIKARSSSAGAGADCPRARPCPAGQGCVARPLQTAHRRDPPMDAAEPPVKQPSLEMDGLGSDLALPPSWADWPGDHGEPCRGPVSVLSPRKAEVVVAR